jgi:hypothetical protein
MFRRLLCRALLLALVALLTTAGLAFAEGPTTTALTDAGNTDVVSTGATGTAQAQGQSQSSVAPSDAEHWTAYGYNITAPSSMWPMLELLHKEKFDWELASASARPTPIVWADMAAGNYGQYSPSQNVLRLSRVLQGSSVEVATAFLAHELTHLTDDINGQLGDMKGDVCYAAETRAFINEANFWQMVVGPHGKKTHDIIEQKENTKMFAFVGNPGFADLVLRTTASYVRQCGS